MKLSELLVEGMTKYEKIFNKTCTTAAAKLLGVDKVRVVWPGNPAWIKYDGWAEFAEQGKMEEIRTSDLFDYDEDDDDIPYTDDGVETLTHMTSGNDTFVKGEYNDYGGGDDPHYYVPVKSKK